MARSFVVQLVILALLHQLKTLKAQQEQNSTANQSLQYHHVCPKDFENIGRKCYYFSQSTTTWFAALFTCRDLKGNLSVFTERYDQRHLEQYLFKNKQIRNRPNGLNEFWVGGFKDWKRKQWVYPDGSLLQFPTLKDIHSIHQDNWTCLLIDSNMKRWSAKNCIEKHPFICESPIEASVILKIIDKKVKRRITIDECISNSAKLTKKQKRKCLKLLNDNDNPNNEPAAVMQPSRPGYTSNSIKAISHICPQNWMSLGNNCYLFSKDKVTWSNAHFNCDQINSKLAIVRSRVQDQKLRIFLNGFTEKQERWIGGRYNGKRNEWIWALNGKPLKYKGFAEEPKVNSSDPIYWHAIVMDPVYGYKWSHRNELEKHAYICQVKGRAVKRLNYPRRPSATIQITQHKWRNLNKRRDRSSSRRSNRNKRY
ncbi:hypothetical protein ABEB36_007996 [Hypothenemus hampei]|uniref:C-type lectin domain-containing protein n=1 Tax=Hypothenemus hampei TaxID=57062 RepID=A0ABD1EKB9_HYPHA